MVGSDNEMICWCNGVTAGTIRQACRDGAETLEAVKQATGACTVGNCQQASPRGR